MLLTMVYRNLLMAHLEWGARLFIDESRTLLTKLDYVRNAALSVVLGCMRTTPLEVLL